MKTAVIKTFILLIVLLTAAAFPYRAYAEESVIIDGYSADIPPELEKSLSDAGITPQSIDSEALSVDKVISNVTGMLWESIKSPLKLLISLISVTLLCSIANVFADNTSGNLKTVFSLVSVLACSTITVSAASDSLTAASKTLESGSVFLASFIPAFAGILATSGHVSSAAMFNTVVMGCAGLYAACVKDTYACINEHTRNIACRERMRRTEAGNACTGGEKDGYMDTGSYNDRIRGASCNAKLYHCAVR